MEVMFYSNEDGRQFKGDPLVVFNYLQQDHSIFISVIMLCIVVALMLWIFLGFHMYQIREGQTTNEREKVQRLVYFLGRADNFFAEWEALKKVDSSAMPPQAQEALAFFDIKDDLKLAEISRMKKETEADLEQIERGSFWRPRSLL